MDWVVCARVALPHQANRSVAGPSAVAGAVGVEPDEQPVTTTASAATAVTHRTVLTRFIFISFDAVSSSVGDPSSFCHSLRLNWTAAEAAQLCG